MTHASDQRPTRRVVLSSSRGRASDLREFVVEIGAQTITIRPTRTRRGGPQSCTVTWGWIYLKAAQLKAENLRRERLAARQTRKRVRR